MNTLNHDFRAAARMPRPITTRGGGVILTAADGRNITTSFTTLTDAATGVKLGAQSGSLVLAGLFALGAYFIFLPVVRYEEGALHAVFGPEFDAYRMRVPRFLPKFSQWRDVPILQINPRRYRQTILDGLVLLSLVPAMYGAGWLRGLAPGLPLLHLP